MQVFMGFWRRNLDDGPKPVHFYNDYGTFTHIISYRSGGCTDSAVATVNVYDARASTHIDFNRLQPVIRLPSILLYGSPGFKYDFDFDDGSSDSSGQANLTHLYPAPGNFAPALTITDEFGCQSRIPSGPFTFMALFLFGKDKKEFCDTGFGNI
jgi:hypothetical protein